MQGRICMWESFLQGKKMDNVNNSTRYEFCVNVRNSLTLAEKCRKPMQLESAASLRYLAANLIKHSDEDRIIRLSQMDESELLLREEQWEIWISIFDYTVVI